jgi:hypothetical protein
MPFNSKPSFTAFSKVIYLRLLIVTASRLLQTPSPIVTSRSATGRFFIN